jgi:hypothetical protein
MTFATMALLLLPVGAFPLFRHGYPYRQQQILARHELDIVRCDPHRKDVDFPASQVDAADRISILVCRVHETSTVTRRETVMRPTDAAVAIVAEFFEWLLVMIFCSLAFSRRIQRCNQPK